MYANKPEMAAEWERETPKGTKLPERVTKKEIHQLAAKAKIPWDDDPKFKRWSKKLTGKSHLDEMTPAQLSKMKRGIVKRSKKKVPQVGHVEQRAKQRSKVSSKEINQLRKSLLGMRLRKGMTYHYTWPGRGHAIIGDVGAKVPKHVVKTMYRPTDPPPGSRITKLAGGGARALKSYTRAVRRMAADVAESSGKNYDDVLRGMLSNSQGVHHTYSATGKGLRGVPKGSTAHLTTGGPYLRDNAGLIDTIPLDSIRKMKGRFGIDQRAIAFPDDAAGLPLVYRGKASKSLIKTDKYGDKALRQMGSIPREISPGEHGWAGALGRADSKLSAQYLGRKGQTWENSSGLDRAIFDSANPPKMTEKMRRSFNKLKERLYEIHPGY